MSHGADLGMSGFKLLCVVMVLMGLVASAMPERARACSCSLLHLTWSSPVEGAQDVPTDVAPALLGAFGEIEFERADGAPVAFIRTDANDTALFCDTNSELVPERPLLPDTAYVVRVHAERTVEGQPSAIELHFTTGASASTERELPAPQLDLDLFRAETMVNSCSHIAGGCLRTAPQEQLELAFFEGNTLLARRIMFDAQTPILARVPDCIEGRTRDIAGRRSPATRLCGTQLSFRVVPSSVEFYAACEPGAPEPPQEPLDDADQHARAGWEDAGCSAAGGRGPTSIDASWLPGLTLLLLVRRRRSVA